MKFLLRWISRFLLMGLVVSLLVTNSVAQAVAAWALCAYLVWSARKSLRRDIGRVWYWTAFTSVPSFSVFRRGRGELL